MGHVVIDQDPRDGIAAAMTLRSPTAPAPGGLTPMAQGRLERKAGNFAGAIEAFREAVRLSPNAAEPVFLLCATLLQRADPRANGMVQALLERFPDDAAGWEEIGLALSEAGKRDAALVCFTRADAAAPNFVLAMRRGSILRSLGRIAEAGAAFADACRRDGRSDRAFFMLGLCAQDGGDRPAARDAYRQALALNPALAEAAVNLGTVLQDQGDLDAAKAAYGSALRTRADTFGRIAQAMTACPKGELWLDLGRLRRHLTG